MRGEVELSARQKVVRVIGGASLMGVLLMGLFSPVALGLRPGASHTATAVTALLYLSVAVALSLLAMLMAIMDFGEVSRQYTHARRDLRTRSITREDIDRLIAAERRDNPEDIGRHREGDDS